MFNHFAALCKSTLPLEAEITATESRANKLAGKMRVTAKAISFSFLPPQILQFQPHFVPVKHQLAQSHPDHYMLYLQ